MPQLRSRLATIRDEAVRLLVAMTPMDLLRGSYYS